MGQSIRCRQIVVIRSIQLALPNTQNPGAGKSQNKIHHHGNGKGLKIEIFCPGHTFGRIEQLNRSNNRKNAGILDVDNQDLFQLL